MLKLKKKTVDVLLKSALKLNSIVNKYTDESIEKMTGNQLRTICYEMLSYEHDTKKFKEYIIKDIKDHLYILEGQEVNFKWIEEIPDESYNLPNTIYKKITHYESFKIENGVIKTKIYIDENEGQWLEIILDTLLFEKFHSFYEEFMKKINKDSIFAKLAKVKEDLL